MEIAILPHAWKNPAVKAEFVADSKETIEKYPNQKLPAEDLEKIAGGMDIVAGISFITACADAGTKINHGC